MTVSDAEDYVPTPDGTIFKKNEIIYDDFPEEVTAKQPLEGDYNSIWSKPKIRPNTKFELEDDLILEEEVDCECAIGAPVLFSAKKANTWQPSSSPQKDSPVEEIEPLTTTWQPSFEEIIAVAKGELGELLTVKKSLTEENTVVAASEVEYINIADEGTTYSGKNTNYEDST